MGGEDTQLVSNITYNATTLEISLQAGSIGLFMVLATVANALVGASIYLNRSLHTISNMFIGNLATVDFMSGLLVFPFVLVAAINQSWWFGRWMCKINAFLTHVNSSTSLLTLACIAFDRYQAVCNPMFYHNRATKSIARKAIVMSWVLSIILSSPVLFGVATEFDQARCGCVTSRYDFSTYTYCRAFRMATAIGPVLVICFCYWQIFAVVRKQCRAINQLPGTDKQARLRVTEAKAARMLGVVIIAFVVCYIPFTVVLLVGKEKVPPVWQTVAHWMSYSSAVLNPISYGLQAREIRRGFAKFLPSFCSSETRRGSIETAETGGNRLKDDREIIKPNPVFAFDGKINPDDIIIDEQTPPKKASACSQASSLTSESGKSNIYVRKVVITNPTVYYRCSAPESVSLRPNPDGISISSSDDHESDFRPFDPWRPSTSTLGENCTRSPEDIFTITMATTRRNESRRKFRDAVRKILLARRLRCQKAKPGQLYPPTRRDHLGPASTTNMPGHKKVVTDRCPYLVLLEKTNGTGPDRDHV
ncbi:HCRTR2 [Branchiostoma lanceolatum]|uniref:HCRTR2 protein n=1 Tax=Branchiostoma lanceolatum TaxID=7740 RepID=A0A8J9ZPE3_BRALA|nr:HCRTR2 [Branchiostoma lanceolatum]